jgi:two-component system, chemotaxis family, CheB/CheR fusion protein
MDERAEPSREASTEGHDQPDGGPRTPTVVGIGASAGALQALKQFFAGVQPDSGLAYVVVIHLASEQESFLADLLQPHAPIPVTQVTEFTPVEPDRVYVIPPGRYLSAVDSHLRLSSMPGERSGRAPIDHFFRTLAATHDGSSVAVVLSGTGSDGALGVRHIHEQGGIVVVQDPGEAEFDGMPRSAIDTGIVDLVLPVAEIPARIREYVRTEPRVHDDGGPDSAADPDDRDRVQRILTQVRVRTGQDFGRYKRSTIERRIERRMQLQGIERLPDYLATLREKPQEAQALADDLLINVTSFFRDHVVFEHLEREVVPRLFEGKRAKDGVRVWSVGCSTGEEAFSLGMLLLEEAARRDAPPAIQLFASDLHERSLKYAREGLYPETVAADVPPERLDRFFKRENGSYRVRKELRDLIVFAPHNLLRDPPFSRLDLVVCRNVLIYLQREVQQEVIELFHYALQGEGYLLLGTAETIDRSDLFRPESKEHHLFRRRNVARPEFRLPSLPLAAAHSRPPPLPGAVPARTDTAAAYGELHQRMVEQFAPPSLLVDADHNVLHLSEHVGRFLQVQGGSFTNNVFKLVREELRMELRAALQLARERQATTRSRPVPVRIDGENGRVVLRVSPAGADQTDGLVLVIFDELGELPPAKAETAPPGPDDSAVRELEAELELTRNRLQALVEEYETSQEEMRASNEELQSANEELRSTMEELETSREELQSINEELQTLNQENRHRVEELSHLSSDLQNLLKVTDVATLFLDRGLRILRFTPRVGELFNIRATDRGRPLADLTHRLGYAGLLDDARSVLQTLVPVEHEVESEDGRWHLVRVLPYRTVEDRIDGVVITLVDVTRLKRSEAALRETSERLDAIFEVLPAGLALSDASGRVLRFNEMLVRIWGRPPSPENTADYGQWKGRWAESGEPLAPADWAMARALRTGEVVTGDVVEIERFDGGTATIINAAAPIRDANGQVVGGVVAEIDITAQKRAEDEVRRSEARYRALVTASSDAVYRMSPDWSEMRELDGRGFLMDTDRPRTRWLDDYILRDDQPRVLETVRAAIRARTPFALEHRVRLADGSIGWTSSRAIPLFDEQGEIVEWFGMASDVTERKRREMNREFLADVSGEFNRLTTEEEIIGSVGRKLVDHLGLACYHYVDIDDDRSEAAIRHFWHEEDVPDILGTDPLEGFLPPEGIARFRAGETEVVADVRLLADDDPATAAVKAAAAAQKIGALLVVPYSEDGRWKAYFAVADSRPRSWTPLEVELIREVAGRIFPRVERVRAEAALRQSEAKYRTLFESMDEGFCIIERVSLDPPDFRYLEANPAFAAQSGVHDVVGRTIREVVPGEPEEWLETYDRVLRTRVPVRFERELVTAERMLELYAFPVGDEPDERVAVIFKDTTEQTAAGAALRQSEERQAFLLKLTDALRTLTGPAAIRAEASRVLGVRLGVNRSFYAEVDGEEWTVANPYEHDIDRQAEGRHPIAQFGSWVVDDFRAGRTLVIRDLHGDDRFDPSQRAAHEAYRIRGAVAVPLVKGGSLIAILAVQSAAPRDWTDLEIALVRETAERTWTAVEYARAEQALRESEERRRLALDAAAMGTYLWHVPEDRGEPDARVLQLFGFPPGGGFSLVEALERAHPADAPGYAQAVERALAPGGEGQLRAEVRVLQPDGSYRWLAVTGQTAFEGDPPRAMRMAGTVRDITERREAEEALRESEERFRLFGEASSDVLWIRNAESLQWEYLTPAFEAIYGLERAAVLGNDDLGAWAELIVPEDREAALGSIRRVQGGESVSFEYRIRRPDGQIRWLRDTDFPIRDESGHTRHIGGIGQDVTEQKRAEAELREWNETLERRVGERTVELTQAIEGRRRVLRQLVTAEEEERRRISRELHDHFGQQLTGLLLGLRALVQEPANGRLDDLERLTDGIARDIQRMAVELRPPALDNLGLAVALQLHLDDWSDRHGIAVDFHATGFDEARLSREVETTLYRVAQEGLTNTLKTRRRRPRAASRTGEPDPGGQRRRLRRRRGVRPRRPDAAARPARDGRARRAARRRAGDRVVAGERHHDLRPAPGSGPELAGTDSGRQRMSVPPPTPLRPR